MKSIRLDNKGLLNRDLINDKELLRLWIFNGKAISHLFNLNTKTIEVSSYMDEKRAGTQTPISNKGTFNTEIYNEENKKIIEEIKNILSTIGESKGFIADGLINPKKYADEKVKIICFLSESYGWADDKYKDGVNIQVQRRGNDILGLLNSKVGVTRPLASFLYLFYESIQRNCPVSYDDFRQKELLKISNQLDNNINLQETLEKTAWINVKKLSKYTEQGTEQDYNDVYSHAILNKEVLKRQIEITWPDVILIFSNVAFDSLYDMNLLGDVKKNLKFKPQKNEYGQIILQLNHPSKWHSYESIHENYRILYEGYLENITE